MASADVLVVIPVLNEAKTLPALLAQQLGEAGNSTIVVADGGSTDGSRAIVAALAVKDPRLILLDNPARLQAAGVNLAMRRFGAEAHWLVRIDAHCDYPPGYVRRLLDAAAERQASSVVVPMISRGTSCFQIAAATAQNSPLGTGGSPHRHIGSGQFVDHGHHALMDAASFRAVGGYREDMAANEDAELDARLLAAGGRLWLEPSLALIYYPRRTAAALWRQYWRYGAGRARTLRLHRRRPKLRQLLPLAVPAAAVLALATPITPLATLPLGLWGLASIAAGVVIGARAGGGCSLASGLAAMTMHFAWGSGFVASFVRRPPRR